MREIRGTVEEFRDELENHPKKVKTLTFLGKMLSMGVIFQILLSTDPGTVFLQRALADITASVLSISGLQAFSEGISVMTETGAYIITRDCLGWKSLAVFSALVISTPDIEKKLKTFIIGSGLILAVNLARVATTVFLAEKGMISFDIIHTFLWKWGMTLLVLVLWYYSLSETPFRQRFDIPLNRGLKN